MESKKVTKCLLAVYLLALIWIVIFKLQFSFDHLPHIRNVNLIPFGDSTIINGTIDFDEIIANLIAFIPFGILIGMLFEGKSFIKKVSPIFFTSLFLETIQFVFSIGASDITDLLMNTVGGILGIVLFLALSKILKNKTIKILNILCLVGAILLFSLIGLIQLNTL